MNTISVLIAVLLAGAVFAAFRSYRKHKGGCGGCEGYSGCTRNCEKRKQ